jgi:DNA-3-methyladenine glycosylase I
MPCRFTGDYHDAVWGTPVTNRTELFAQLSLASQQAGVSWRIVWNKRHHYRDAFKEWNMDEIAAMTESDLDGLCDKDGPWAGKLMQNRKKLGAIIHNARQCAKIDQEHPGGLSAFLWSVVQNGQGQVAPARSFEVVGTGADAPRFFVDAKSINACESCSSSAYDATFGQTSAYSDRLAAILKRKGKRKRGGDSGGNGVGHHAVTFAPFQFLGSVTLQAFMLQVGILNGHTPSCAKNPRCNPSAEGYAACAHPISEGSTSSPRNTATTTARKRRRRR